MTVDEFNQILQLLYDNDYILVSIRDLANVTENSDGSVSIAAAELELPEGKKPFVLSQNDVSYPLTLLPGDTQPGCWWMRAETWYRNISRPTEPL